MRCCVENAEGYCQSYPNCEGCGSHITGGKCASSIGRLEQMLAKKEQELQEAKKDRDKYKKLYDLFLDKIASMCQVQTDRRWMEELRMDNITKKLIVATILAIASMVITTISLIVK